jgi:serine/threonine protein kinase/tetratricopeptide (TPR) repeat protein
MIGKTLAHYEILDKLGAGGMGDVYRARDTKLDREVAIKVLPSEFSEDAERRKRFEREAKAIAALKHPNIVTIYSVEEADAVHFISMEFVEGRTLSDLIDAGGLSVERFFEYAIPLAEAISSAHDQGITHRDLKPANIMLDRDGRLKVLDFGLAKLLSPGPDPSDARTQVASSDTAVGQIVGTAAYMSPEQAEGKAIDSRSDIFSLGIVYYEMATGEKPFKGDTRISTISSIIKDHPRPISDIKASLPRHLARIVNRCLEKNPENRFQSAKDVRNDLSGLKREIDTGELGSSTTIGGTSHSGISPAAPVPPAPASKRWLPWMIGGALVVALASVYLALKPDSNTTEVTSAQSNTQTPTVASAPPAAGPQTVAADARKMTVVFPFANLGPPEDEYFAAGMAEEISSRLATIKNLGVISRTSATQYDRTGKTMKQIAEDLGVDYVLEGTVRWAKQNETSRVRITPQLIRVSDDTQVWSETFDREIDDIFQIQTDIATRVIDQLGVTLLGSERESIAGAPTENIEAYQLLLQARNLTPTGNFAEEEAAKRELLEKATQLDPTFAEAWAELSRHHSSTYQVFDQTDERLSECRAALQRARELDPDSHHTRLAAGYYHYYGFREYDVALREFHAAANAVPNDSECRRAIGYIQRRQGKWAECLESLKAALELDPQDANLASNIGGMYDGLREFEEAIRYYDRALQLAPDDPNPAWSKAASIIAWKGDLKKARSAFALHTAPGQFYYHVGSYVLALMERNPDEAVRQAEQLPEDSSILAVAKAHLLSAARAMATSPEEAMADLEEAGKATESALDLAPSNHVLRSWYAWNLAIRGEDAAAIREAKLAVDLTAKDAFEGPSNLETLAQVYGQVGRHEEAIDLLERLLGSVYSNALTHHRLKLDPVWDPLREHPRFRALLREQI